MSSVIVRIDGEPKAMGRPRAFVRGGHAAVYNPHTAEGWKSLVAAAFLPHLPQTPHESALCVDIDFYLPRPKRLCRKCDPDGPVPHTARPDRDNLDKTVLDALKTIGFMRDDSLVCDGRIRKFYHAKADIPHAVVAITWADGRRQSKIAACNDLAGGIITGV